MIQGNYALALDWAGRPAEAETIYRTIPGEMGSHPQHHTNLGGCLLSQGKTAEARDLVLQADALHKQQLADVVAQAASASADEREEMGWMIEHYNFWAVHSHTYVLEYATQAYTTPSTAQYAANALDEAVDILAAATESLGRQNMFILRLEATAALLRRAADEPAGTEALQEVVSRMRVFLGASHEFTKKYVAMLDTN
jgi:hypothetical protein